MDSIFQVIKKKPKTAQKNGSARDIRKQYLYEGAKGKTPANSQYQQNQTMEEQRYMRQYYRPNANRKVKFTQLSQKNTDSFHEGEQKDKVANTTGQRQGNKKPDRIGKFIKKSGGQDQQPRSLKNIIKKQSYSKPRYKPLRNRRNTNDPSFHTEWKSRLKKSEAVKRQYIKWKLERLHDLKRQLNGKLKTGEPIKFKVELTENQIEELPGQKKFESLHGLQTGYKVKQIKKKEKRSLNRKAGAQVARPKKNKFSISSVKRSQAQKIYSFLKQDKVFLENGAKKKNKQNLSSRNIQGGLKLDVSQWMAKKRFTKKQNIKHQKFPSNFAMKRNQPRKTKNNPNPFLSNHADHPNHEKR